MPEQEYGPERWVFDSHEVAAYADDPTRKYDYNTHQPTRIELFRAYLLTNPACHNPIHRDVRIAKQKQEDVAEGVEWNAPEWKMEPQNNTELN